MCHWEILQCYKVVLAFFPVVLVCTGSSGVYVCSFIVSFDSHVVFSVVMMCDWVVLWFY